MIEEGQRLVQQGDAGLKNLVGAETALKEEIKMLDAYVKPDANA